MKPNTYLKLLVVSLSVLCFVLAWRSDNHRKQLQRSLNACNQLIEVAEGWEKVATNAVAIATHWRDEYLKLKIEKEGK